MSFKWRFKVTKQLNFTDSNQTKKKYFVMFNLEFITY